MAVVSPSCPLPVPSAARTSLPEFCSPGLLALVQGIKLHDALLLREGYCRDSQGVSHS